MKALRFRCLWIVAVIVSMALSLVTLPKVLLTTTGELVNVAVAAL